MSPLTWGVVEHNSLYQNPGRFEAATGEHHLEGQGPTKKPLLQALNQVLDGRNLFVGELT